MASSPASSALPSRVEGRFQPGGTELPDICYVRSDLPGAARGSGEALTAGRRAGNFPCQGPVEQGGWWGEPVSSPSPRGHVPPPGRLLLPLQPCVQEPRSTGMGASAARPRLLSFPSPSRDFSCLALSLPIAHWKVRRVRQEPAQQREVEVESRKGALSQSRAGEAGPGSPALGETSPASCLGTPCLSPRNPSRAPARRSMVLSTNRIPWHGKGNPSWLQ